MSRLTKANLNDAILTGAELFGIQLSGWSIRNVDCEYVYWKDEGKINEEIYQPGEFESLFGNIEALRKMIQTDAEQKAHYLSKALETMGENLLLKAEVRALNRQIDKLLSN
jgi:uncharacterized protein YjbI with pentapeptide repeats